MQLPFFCIISENMPQKNYAFRMSTGSNILLNGRDKTRADNLPNLR